MSSAFFEKVYDAVAQIPPGFVMTYGQIAEIIGHPGAARRVGQAMSQAPAARCLPCHRVVNAAGRLAPARAFGSQEAQCALLQREGVCFLPDGRINLALCRWQQL